MKTETKQITGSVAVIEALIAEEVAVIFGIPGGANIAIYASRS